MQKITHMPTAAAAVALAAGLALAGCGSSGSSSSDSSPSGSATRTATSSASSVTTTAATGASVPFPVAVGNTWNYNITTAGESGTTVNKMTAVTPVAGGQQVTMAGTSHLAGVSTSTREIYVFHSDGSISVPLGQMSPGSEVTVTTSSGVVYPSASVLDSGKPSQSQLKLSIKALGQTVSATAHVTVQYEGTAAVTVPAGTYQATVVLATERTSVVGVTTTIQARTWFAPGVGPVKTQVVTDEGSGSTIAATEELVSFTKG